MKSTPSITSRLRGETSRSKGKTRTGRRLAYSSRACRSRRRPRSGRRSPGRVSHLGPPAAPSKMASASRPEQKGVRLPTPAKGLFGQRIAGRIDGHTAEKRLLEFQRDAVSSGGGREDLSALLDHFRAAP